MLRERGSANICARMLGLGRFRALAGATFGTVALASGALALASAALGATATAPTLSVKVAPSTVHPGQQYKITINGSYDRKALKSQAYLIAFIQYTGAPCKATAKAEASLPKTKRGFDFGSKAGIFVPASFSRYDNWTASHTLGKRQVCAYLYSLRVSLRSNATPLVTASAAYRNT
jgi:hypothetical protein